jgi:hypothetical protein
LWHKSLLLSSLLWAPEGGSLPLRPRVPHLEGAVPTRGDDEGAIGADGAGIDRPCVARQGAGHGFRLTERGLQTQPGSSSRPLRRRRAAPPSRRRACPLAGLCSMPRGSRTRCRQGTPVSAASGGLVRAATDTAGRLARQPASRCSSRLRLGQAQRSANIGRTR